jgi:hypothetical protein
MKEDQIVLKYSKKHWKILQIKEFSQKNLKNIATP